MVFRKKTEPSCSYCVFGSRISNTEVMCSKHGISSSAGKCGKFRYDPLKRIPARPIIIDTSVYSENDFII